MASVTQIRGRGSTHRGLIAARRAERGRGRLGSRGSGRGRGRIGNTKSNVNSNDISETKTDSASETKTKQNEVSPINDNESNDTSASPNSTLPKSTRRGRGGRGMPPSRSRGRRGTIRGNIRGRGHRSRGAAKPNSERSEMITPNAERNDISSPVTEQNVDRSKPNDDTRIVSDDRKEDENADALSSLNNDEIKDVNESPLTVSESKRTEESEILDTNQRDIDDDANSVPKSIRKGGGARKSRASIRGRGRGQIRGRSRLSPPRRGRRGRGRGRESPNPRTKAVVSKSSSDDDSFNISGSDSDAKESADEKPQTIHSPKPQREDKSTSTPRKQEVEPIAMDSERQQYLLLKAKHFRQSINGGMKERYQVMKSKFKKKESRLLSKIQSITEELQRVQARNAELEEALKNRVIGTPSEQKAESKEDTKPEQEEEPTVIPLIERFEDFQLMANAAFSPLEIFPNSLLKNIGDEMEYEEPNEVMKRCLYPIVIQNKHLILCSKSTAMQMDAVALCMVLRLFSLRTADDLKERIKMLCICPTRRLCIDIFTKIQQLMHGMDSQSESVRNSGRKAVDLVIPGQPQSTQQRTVRSRPEILVSTPVLMTEVVLTQIEHNDSKVNDSKMHCIVILNFDQCLDSGFGPMITSIHQQCGAAKNGAKLMICSNSTSSTMEQFVDKLMMNQNVCSLHFLIC